MGLEECGTRNDLEKRDVQLAVALLQESMTRSAYDLLGIDNVVLRELILVKGVGDKDQRSHVLEVNPQINSKAPSILWPAPNSTIQYYNPRSNFASILAGHIKFQDVRFL